MMGKPNRFTMKSQDYYPSSTRNHAQFNNKLKKKVQLNPTIQFMDDNSLCYMDSNDLDRVSDDDGDDGGDVDLEIDLSDQSDKHYDDTDDPTTDDDDSDYMDRAEDSDDNDNHDDDNMDLDEDDFGPLQFRDPKDKEFLLGFELRHFELDDDTGLDNINLRLEESTHEDTSLNDNLAHGLVNALLNSSGRAEKQKGKQLLKKLRGNISNLATEPTKKKKHMNKSGKSKRMMPNKHKKSSKMRSRQVEKSEKLKQIIASAVNHMDPID